MKSDVKHFYAYAGLNRDVNPFLMKDSDLSLCNNFYSKTVGSKKVRFGYTQFLDAIDNQPVRNLYYFNLPNGTKGIFRYSNKKLYLNKFVGSSWNTAVQTYTADTALAFANLAGDVPYVHYSNGTDGLVSFDGSGYWAAVGKSTPKASFLAAWQSRLFADINKLSLAESAIAFNQDGTRLTGTFSATNGSASIVGSGTAFTTEILVGSTISILNTYDGAANTYVVATISNDTHLTIQGTYQETTQSGMVAYTLYYYDPFYSNPNDPAGGGTTELDAGNNGTWVGLTASVDRVNIYKQTGVYRYNGSQFMKFPYFGDIFQNTVCTSKDGIDYFLATNGIMRNDGSKIELASMGVQTIIQDTIQKWGITNPVAYSFDDYTIFYIGTIRIGQGNQAIDVPNGCLVHHERFDEWYVWSLGHQMTAFGYYVDPTSNRPRLISGDTNGNTYVWGEEYFNDNNVPISYHLRTKYWDMGTPSSSKIPDRWYASTNVGSGASIQAATNYTDKFSDLGNVQGFLSKDSFDNESFGPDFKTISLQIKGSTMTDRPELTGFSISYLDQEDRYEDKQANKN